MRKRSALLLNSRWQGARGLRPRGNRESGAGNQEKKGLTAENAENAEVSRAAANPKGHRGEDISCFIKRTSASSAVPAKRLAGRSAVRRAGWGRVWGRTQPDAAARAPRNGSQWSAL